MADVPHLVWALRQRKLSAPERLVLIYLADRANGAMVCWPSIEEIHRDLEVSKRAVMRAVEVLEERGLIRVERRHRQMNHYHIKRVENGTDPEPKEAEPNGSWVTESHSSVPQSHPTATFSVPDCHPTEPVLGATESPKCLVLGATESPLRIPQERIPQGREDSPLTPLAAPVARQAGRVSEPPGFAEFWAGYPRKVGRRAAAAAYAAALKRGTHPDDILDGLDRARPKLLLLDERYRPHPTTWLNQDRWHDEPDTVDPVLRALGLCPDDMATGPFAGMLLQ